MSAADAMTVPSAQARIGRYEIIGHLAAGGMAEILLGRVPGESGFARAVVIKRILHHLARTTELETMFLDEARIVSEIHHPNVVQVFDLGRDGGELFLVMEYLQGESVAGLMRRLATLDEKVDAHLAAHIVAEVCAGLHAAHELRDADGNLRNLVHRDVSPQNVFVGYDGSVKLLDFGIAKTADRLGRTAAGQVKGKFSYMSPEQCRGKALDRRSDVFALGTMLYEVGTGHRLFSRDTVMQTFRAICRDRIVPPSVIRSDFPATLEAICLRALCRSPAERYATAAEMRRDLLRALTEGAAAEPLDEALAARMHRLFVDRIEEKAELMRRVRGGLAVSAVPRAETDIEADIPTVAGGRDESSETGSDETPERAPPAGRLAPRLILVVAALGVVGASSAYLAQRSPSTVTETNTPAAPPSRAAVPVETSAAAPAADIDTSMPTNDPVVFDITSDPPRAAVFLAGVRQGDAPLALRVRRSSAPVIVELRLEGHVPRGEQIVPDHDAQLHWTLAPAARARIPPKPHAATPPGTASPPDVGPASSRPTDYYKF